MPHGWMILCEELFQRRARKHFQLILYFCAPEKLSMQILRCDNYFTWNELDGIGGRVHVI